MAPGFSGQVRSSTVSSIFGRLRKTIFVLTVSQKSPFAAMASKPTPRGSAWAAAMS